MSADEEAMTSDEAFTFLRNVLCLMSLESKMKTDREALLQELISSWQHHVLFQTVRSFATPHLERRCPTISEIKREVFAKIGGRCYYNNTSCYLILCAIGFDVSLIASDIKCEGNHIITIVHHLTRQGSKHLVDVGSGYPTLCAIPLDFGRESPEYHDSFLRYKFVRNGNVLFRLHNALSDPAGVRQFKESLKDGWFTFIIIHVDTYVDISYFDHVMASRYTDVVEGAPFLSSIFCMAFPFGRFVCIRNTTALVENEEGLVEKTYFKSRDEIISAFARYFPQIPEEMITAAMDDKNVSLDFSK